MGRWRYRLPFLTFTALAIVTECWFAWDGDPETEPWTELIVQYIPDEVTMLAIGGLFLWLLVHFGKRYWKRRQRPVD